MSKRKRVRAYRLAHCGNAGKVAAVAAVLVPYRVAMGQVAAEQLRRFRMDGAGFWNRADPSYVESVLSQRYVRSAQNQAVAAMDGWLALAKLAVRKHVTRSSLPAEVKRDVYWLNACGMYGRHGRLSVFDADGQPVAGPRTVEDTVAAQRLLRAIVKHVIARHEGLPDLSRVSTMTLDGTVAQIEQDRGTSFDMWVRVSTLTAGRPVRLPLYTNHYFDQAAGEVANFAQITIIADRQVTVTLVKNSEPAPIRGAAGGVLALDWGMVTMFADQHGGLHGQSLYRWLAARDVELAALTAELQRQGVKPNQSKRYRRLQARISGHVRNETGRVINRLIAVHQPSTIVVEQLDFRDGGLSKRMNRLLSRCGRAAISSKLATVHEDFGITVEEINPAHTSRQCSGCGNVNPFNRQRARYDCGFCGKRIHADINAARVTAHRRSTGFHALRLSRHATLQRLDHQFEQRWNLPAGTAVELRGRPKQRESTPNNRRARRDHSNRQTATAGPPQTESETA